VSLISGESLSLPQGDDIGDISFFERSSAVFSTSIGELERGRLNADDLLIAKDIGCILSIYIDIQQ
jgi:hypothetical protein